jgi:hypothetical protein
MIPRFATLLLLMAMLAAGASAYEIVIDAPVSLQAGAPLVVNGTTNLADGVNIDLVLSNADYSTTEIAKKNVVIQHNDENKSFSVTFDTTGLKKGQYKVEVMPVAGFSFLGASVTLRPVTLVDRSDELVMAPPLKKEYDGSLTIAGNYPRLINSGVEVIVTSSNGTLLFGPEFIGTDYMGYFSRTFSIPEPGNYLVHFSDARGFITNISYTITKPAEPLPGISLPDVAGTPAPPQFPTVSAASPATRDSPAYFAVIARPGPVRVYTSTGTDWVMEYLDRSGKPQRIQQSGSLDPETLTFQGEGNTTWVKVYPFKYADNGTVTLYAENALDVQVAQSGADLFPVTYATTGIPEASQTSPLPWLLIVGAAGAGIAFVLKKRD